MAQQTQLKANALPGRISTFIAKAAASGITLVSHYYLSLSQGHSMGLQNNVSSQKALVFAFNTTTNAAVTGDASNITGKIRIDYAAASGISDTNPTEIEDGYYEFDLTQAETNGGVLDILPESSTSNVKVIGVPARIFTVPSGFDDLITDIETAQNDLDIITGSDGVTLATSQGNYAPNTTTPPSAAAIRSEIDSNSTQLASIVADTNELQSDDVPALIASLNNLSAAEVNAQCDSAISDASLATAANLATVDSVVDGIQTDLSNATDGLGALKTLIDAVQTAVDALNDVSVADVLTTQMTEAYAADGTAPTLAQALFAIQQFLQERSTAGTTVTVKKLDGSTGAMTLTLDDATTPTSITRAT